MPGPGPCCILEVCCPPRKAKQALVEELRAGVTPGWDPVEGIAEFILSHYRLVPRDLDTETHERLDQGLRAWLKERGHPLTAS